MTILRGCHVVIYGSLGVHVGPHSADTIAHSLEKIGDLSATILLAPSFYARVRPTTITHFVSYSESKTKVLILPT